VVFSSFCCRHECMQQYIECFAFAHLQCGHLHLVWMVVHAWKDSCLFAAVAKCFERDDEVLLRRSHAPVFIDLTGCISEGCAAWRTHWSRTIDLRSQKGARRRRGFSPDAARAPVSNGPTVQKKGQCNGLEVYYTTLVVT